MSVTSIEPAPSPAVIDHARPAPPAPPAHPAWRRWATSIHVHILICLALFVAYNRFAFWYGSDTTQPRFGDAPPVYAHVRLAPLSGWRLLWLAPPLAIFLGWSDVLALRLRRRRFMPEWAFVPLAVAFVFGMNTAVATMDGGMTPLVHPFTRTALEYVGDVPRARELGAATFLRDYPLQGKRISHHAGTHPPGGVLVLYWASQWFGYDVRTACWVAIALTSLGVIPAYLLAREIGGPLLAALASGLYVVTPSLVLYGATSMDGVFLVLPVTGLWLFHAAINRRGRLATIAWSVACGIAVAGAMMMTFATVCLGVVWALYALLVPRSQYPRVLAALLIAAATFAACYVALYLTVGYDLIATVFAAMERDASVMGSGYETARRYWDVSAANLLAFLVGIGIPVTTLWVREVVGTAIAKAPSADSGAWRAFILSFAIGIVLLAFATLFTLEVERIWIFLAPLALVPAARHVAARAAISPRLFYDVLALTFLQTWLMELLLYTSW